MVHPHTRHPPQQRQRQQSFGSLSDAAAVADLMSFHEHAPSPSDAGVKQPSSHQPRVVVQWSSQGEGLGVFVTHRVEAGTPLALYPGIYTPGVPSSRMCTCGEEAADPEAFSCVQYLADQTTPSGLSATDNAYILTLGAGLGYLDGLALEVPIDDDDDDENVSFHSDAPMDCAGGTGAAAAAAAAGSSEYYHQPGRRRRLDAHPHACAHRINHSRRYANVRVHVFSWNVLAAAAAKEPPARLSAWMSMIPNVSRFDGSPWYRQHKCFFEPPPGDDDNDESMPSSPWHVVSFPSSSSLDRSAAAALSCPTRGAYVVATQPLEAGTEVLLDYKLRGPPYPAWAASWYAEAV